MNDEQLPNEPIDVRNCLANDMGRMKIGLASEEEIDELIDKRTDVGKKGRSKYGRLVCQYEGCEAICNVEIKDGILIEKGMDQPIALLGNCSVWKGLGMQDLVHHSET